MQVLVNNGEKAAVDSSVKIRQFPDMNLRTFKSVSRFLPILLLTLVFAACAQNRCLVKQSDVMQPRKIVLRDDQGVERAMLLIRDGQAHLSLHNADGSTLFDFNFAEAGLHIEVQDKDGKPMSMTVSSEPVDEKSAK